MGRLLASRSSRRFLDLDDLTAAELGHANAGTALAAVGEEAFRRAERAVLARVIHADSGCIAALGGGTLASADSRQLLRDAAGPPGPTRAVPSIVYLRAEPETLAARVAADPALRPRLTTLEPIDEMRLLFSQRDGPYRAIASVVIQTDALSPSEAADRAASFLNL